MPAIPEAPVLVCPDSFTGTLRAAEVASCIGRGLERAGLVPPDRCPVADGAAGTQEVLLTALGGETRGRLALIDDGGTAIVEEEDPRDAGELIAAAAAEGAAVVLVATGACATAEGAVEALREAGGPGGARLVALCDRRPLADAGGGLAGALHEAFGAVLEPGAAFVLGELGFDARMRAARAVVVGEGRLDAASLRPNLAGEIAMRARQAGVPCHAIVGGDALDPFGRRILDLQVVLEAPTRAALEAAGERLGGLLARREA